MLEEGFQESTLRQNAQPNGEKGKRVFFGPRNMNLNSNLAQRVMDIISNLVRGMNLDFPRSMTFRL